MTRPSLSDRLARACEERARESLLRRLRTISAVDGPRSSSRKNALFLLHHDYLGLRSSPARRGADLGARSMGFAPLRSLLGGPPRGTGDSNRLANGSGANAATVFDRLHGQSRPHAGIAGSARTLRAGQDQPRLPDRWRATLRRAHASLRARGRRQRTAPTGIRSGGSGIAGDRWRVQHGWRHRPLAPLAELCRGTAGNLVVDDAHVWACSVRKVLAAWPKRVLDRTKSRC